MLAVLVDGMVVVLGRVLAPELVRVPAVLVFHGAAS